MDLSSENEMLKMLLKLWCWICMCEGGRDEDNALDLVFYCVSVHFSKKKPPLSCVLFHFFSFQFEMLVENERYGWV